MESWKCIYESDVLKGCCVNVANEWVIEFSSVD